MFCASLWALASTLASVPLILNYVPKSGSCIFFYFGAGSSLIWFYNIAVFIIFNTVLLLLLLGSTLMSMTVIYRSYKMVTSKGHVSGGKGLGRKFLVLGAPLAFSFASWLPIQGILLSSLTKESYGSDLIGWFIIFVLPFTSLVNPILHTIRIILRNIKQK